LVQTTLEKGKILYRTRQRKSNFIRLFNKTVKGIVCPSFWLLAWADGCPYHCTYCYLQGTFRGKTEPTVFTNLEKLFRELEVWLKDPKPKILNTGELTDSLAITSEVMVKLIERFAKQRTHKLLLVTKSDRVDEILNLEHNNQTIVSFSLNAFSVAEKFEVDAPHPKKRLKAAWKCKEAGYVVRVRIDPMIPVSGWVEEYEELAEEVNSLNPERVTLGSLRFYPVVKVFSRRDHSVFSFASEKTVDGRWRLPQPVRLEMYGTMLRKLKVRPVSLCKETTYVVKTLRLQQKCNCVL